MDQATTLVENNTEYSNVKLKIIQNSMDQAQTLVENQVIWFDIEFKQAFCLLNNMST
jgi:hypothetical protein